MYHHDYSNWLTAARASAKLYRLGCVTHESSHATYGIFDCCSGGSIRRKESDATTFKAGRPPAVCHTVPKPNCQPNALQTSNWRFEIGAEGGQIEFLRSPPPETQKKLYLHGDPTGFLTLQTISRQCRSDSDGSALYSVL